MLSTGITLIILAWLLSLFGAAAWGFSAGAKKVHDEVMNLIEKWEEGK
jgi:hypothetical protein